MGKGGDIAENADATPKMGTASKEYDQLKHGKDYTANGVDFTWMADEEVRPLPVCARCPRSSMPIRAHACKSPFFPRPPAAAAT